MFQRFIMILSEHVVRCDTDGKDFNTFWYQWTVGRLQQVFMAVRRRFYRVLLGFTCFFCFVFFGGFIAPRASGKVQPDVGDAAVHAGPRRQHSRHVPTVPGAARLTRRLVALFFSFFFFCLLTTLRPSLLSRLLFIGNSLSHFPFG